MDASLFGPALGAVATICGVLIAQRSTKSRDREILLWNKRAETYHELYKWINDVSTQMGLDDYTGKVVAPGVSNLDDILGQLLPRDELRVEVKLYASLAAQRYFHSCIHSMVELRAWDDELRRKNVGNFLYRLRCLREDLNREMEIKQRRTVKELLGEARWRLFILLDKLKLREIKFYKPGIDVSFAEDGLNPDGDEERDQANEGLANQ